MADKNWMQKVSKSIKKRGTAGVLTATAKRAGALTARGTIKVGWLKDKAKGKGITAKRARLALVYKGVKRTKKK